MHYDQNLEKYVQIQTYGFGSASIGIRLADRPEGPWTEAQTIYEPVVDANHFVYSANAHPEIAPEGLLITYNVNSFDFDELVNNEEIYFPRMLKLFLNDIR